MSAPTLPNRSPLPKDAIDLPLAGLVPLSLTDWPGQLVATVFTQGCPFDCVYCHNPALISTTSPAQLPFTALTQLLSRRHGLLDGVVISGGEPTRHRGLGAALRQIKARGFATGLHTMGAYPDRLQQLLDDGLVDWVGLDIKALPADYPQAVGRAHPTAGDKAWRSLTLLQASGLDYEVRTTVHPGSSALTQLPALATQLREAGVGDWVIQPARSQGTRAGFVATTPAYPAELDRQVTAARRILPGLRVR